MGIIKEVILVSYEYVNIFQIYFFLEKKIKRVRDLTFIKKYDNNILPHTSINGFLPDENLDPIILNETILSKTLANFINSNYYILSLPICQLLSTISNMFSTLSKLLDKIQFETIEQLHKNQRKR